ncbi:MAG: sigma-70 family RNA polymerase sigma factor [Clostridia bacterium]|nr:sigma-70 family RNA polymerase sigma factor [Clostridia bacterium]
MSKEEIKEFNHLIRKISLGDSNALEQFYKIYGRLIYISAFTITKSPYLADEVTDDILLKVWLNAKKLKKIKNVKGWLYTITVNCAKDKLRSESQASISVGKEIHNPFEELMDKDEFLYDIACLNETEQKIVVFRLVEDMTFNDIAKIFKIPLSSVTSNYYRSLEKIKSNKNSC